MRGFESVRGLAKVGAHLASVDTSRLGQSRQLDQPGKRVVPFGLDQIELIDQCQQGTA